VLRRIWRWLMTPPVIAQPRPYIPLTSPPGLVRARYQETPQTTAYIASIEDYRPNREPGHTRRYPARGPFPAYREAVPAIPGPRRTPPSDMRYGVCHSKPLPGARDRSPWQYCDCDAGPWPHYPGKPNKPPCMPLESVTRSTDDGN